MKEYAADRKAVKLLTKEFFMFITRKVTPYLNFHIMNEHGITSDWIMSNPISRIETIIGFCELMQIYGMGGIRGFYKESTLDNRLKLVGVLQKKSKLPNLEIDYTSIG